MATFLNVELYQAAMLCGTSYNTTVTCPMWLQAKEKNHSHLEASAQSHFEGVFTPAAFHLSHRLQGVAVKLASLLEHHGITLSCALP